MNSLSNDTDQAGTCVNTVAHDGYAPPVPTPPSTSVFITEIRVFGVQKCPNQVTVTGSTWSRPISFTCDTIKNTIDITTFYLALTDLWTFTWSA